jgi:hypothetical protein
MANRSVLARIPRVLSFCLVLSLTLLRSAAGRAATPPSGSISSGSTVSWDFAAVSGVNHDPQHVCLPGNCDTYDLSVVLPSGAPIFYQTNTAMLTIKYTWTSAVPTNLDIIAISPQGTASGPGSPDVPSTGPGEEDLTITDPIDGLWHIRSVAALAPIPTAAHAVATLTTAPRTMATPTLVQRVAYGALFSGQGLSSTNFTIRLPNKVGTNNCVVLIMDYDQALSVTSITDDASNTWSSTPAVSADSGAGNMKTQAYVLAGANSRGARLITITFGAAASTAHFLVLEYYNVVISAAVGVTASSITATAPNISTAAISPTSGSLVIHYAMDNANKIGQAGTATVTSWTAQSGWTLEAADYASGRAAGPNDMNAYGLQTRIAPGGSITPTLTTSGANRFASLALEIKAAGSATGTPPAAGIHVKRIGWFTNTALNVATWDEPFPCSGNLLAIFEVQGNITTAPTDSNSNTWTTQVAGVLNNTGGLYYAKNPTTGPTLVLHIPITGTNGNSTTVVYDIEGADTVAPIAQSGTAAGAFSTNFTQPANVTPLNANGVIIDGTAMALGPVTALTSPAGAFFLPVTYPGETDFDTFNNADGFFVDYYGSSLAARSYSWTYPNPGAMPQNVYSTWAEFKAAPAGIRR